MACIFLLFVTIFSVQAQLLQAQLSTHMQSLSEYTQLLQWPEFCQKTHKIIHFSSSHFECCPVWYSAHTHIASHSTDCHTSCTPHCLAPTGQSQRACCGRTKLYTLYTLHTLYSVYRFNQMGWLQCLQTLHSKSVYKYTFKQLEFSRSPPKLHGYEWCKNQKNVL